MSASDKVVFLDVDGVLHPFEANSLFHAPCMSALRNIISQTGAAIVLSSSWQGTPTHMAQVNAALEANGIPHCVGNTVKPNAAGCSRTGAGEAARASEILEWVATNPALCAGGWVALDDLDLRTALPSNRFVRTNAADGLVDRDARAAVELLGGPIAGATLQSPLPSKPGGFNCLVTRGEMQRDAIRAALSGLPT